jgi:hypothetical protein
MLTDIARARSRSILEGRAGAGWPRISMAAWSPRESGRCCWKTDKAIGLVDRFAACFRDRCHRTYVLHEVKTLVAQRVFGLAPGYEDLVDHDELRRDPVLGVLLGKHCPRSRPERRPTVPFGSRHRPRSSRRSSCWRCQPSPAAGRATSACRDGSAPSVCGNGDADHRRRFPG